jgi:hypothetical protein
MMIELNVGTICCAVPTNTSATVSSHVLRRISLGTATASVTDAVAVNGVVELRG